MTVVRPIEEALQRRVAGASCVVTGGAGFIGRHLVERLLAYGARRVIALDRAARIAVMRSRPQERAPELVAVDLAEARDLHAYLRGCDYLFHLAAEKHARARDAPQLALAVNVLAMERLLNDAAAAGVRKVVFSSSLYAHGRRHAPAMRESDVPAPDTIYGSSKLAGEGLLRHAARERGLAGTALRLFFIYGPRQELAELRPSLITRTFSRILRGQPPLVHGDGQQVLDYLYIDDAVDALLCALDPAVDGELFHVGSGRGSSVSDMVRTMLAVAGSALPVERVAADGSAGSQRVADIAHARSRLGWTPRTSLEQGLARTLEYLRADGRRAS